MTIFAVAISTFAFFCCLIVAVASYVQSLLCFLELNKTKLEIGSIQERIEAVYFRVDQRLKDFVPEITSDSVEPGLYSKKIDPVSGESRWVKAEQQKAFQDILDKPLAPEEDLLEEMVDMWAKK